MDALTPLLVVCGPLYPICGSLWLPHTSSDGLWSPHTLLLVAYGLLHPISGSLWFPEPHLWWHAYFTPELKLK